MVHISHLPEQMPCSHSAAFRKASAGKTAARPHKAGHYEGGFIKTGTGTTWKLRKIRRSAKYNSDSWDKRTKKYPTSRN